MENRINIAELLKDCPTGMELDCTMFEKVTFVRVQMDRQFPIEIAVNGIRSKYLTKEGCFHDNTLLPEAKCVIFPKGKATWEGFVPPCKFKDGDVVANQNNSGTWIGIYHKCDCLNESFSSYCYLIRDGKFCANSDNCHGCYKTRLATEEEKQRLFDAIKANGYKWNEETKTLEKVEAIFKVGDKIRHKEETTWTCVIRRIDDRYWVDGHPTCYTILFGEQDEYELVPNKFDINTLKPLQPVLVRNTNGQVWTMDLFSHKIDTNKGLQTSIVCVGHCPNQCIPYKNNEFLRGTTDDCKDFYKTWE